ncbi:MAG: alpha/beta hydrolase, partial [Pseudomonadota bacterium]|nr:alpha/beta hydrolase [Pseudomonadota bacterium]
MNDVVLVGTSSGGMIAAKTASLAKARIGRVVFVDALVPQPGESTKDIVQRGDADPYEMTGLARGPTRNDLANRLFAELDGAQKEWALVCATPHPNGLSDVAADELKEFWADSWPNSAVVYCVHSENSPEPHQRRTAAGLDAQWIEMDAGHYPMLTHGEE